MKANHPVWWGGSHHWDTQVYTPVPLNTPPNLTSLTQYIQIYISTISCRMEMMRCMCEESELCIIWCMLYALCGPFARHMSTTSLDYPDRTPPRHSLRSSQCRTQFPRKCPRAPINCNHWDTWGECSNLSSIKRGAYEFHSSNKHTWTVASIISF